MFGTTPLDTVACWRGSSGAETSGLTPDMMEIVEKLTLTAQVELGKVKVRISDDDWSRGQKAVSAVTLPLAVEMAGARKGV